MPISSAPILNHINTKPFQMWFVEVQAKVPDLSVPPIREAVVLSNGTIALSWSSWFNELKEKLPAEIPYPPLRTSLYISKSLSLAWSSWFNLIRAAL